MTVVKIAVARSRIELVLQHFAPHRQFSRCAARQPPFSHSGDPSGPHVEGAPEGCLNLRGVKHLPDKDNVSIAPAEGKLGVLIPGMGAVTTTFIAGVEAIKRSLAKPIGSTTQMATIRLGKRTDNNTPRIKDFVPLATLEDLVFGGWDIFEENCYDAAVNAAVLDRPLLDQLKEPLSALKPMPAVF